MLIQADSKGTQSFPSQKFPIELFLPPISLCFSLAIFYFLKERPEIIFVLLREEVNWRLKVAPLLLPSVDKE